MRSIGGFVAAAVLAMALPRVAAADEVEIKDSYFKYGGVRYFRGKAENIEIGSYGQKKEPLTSTNYLAVEAKIASENLASYSKAHTVTKVAIDWAKYNKTDVSTSFGFKYFTMGAKTALTGSYEQFKSAKLQLVKIVIDEGPMKTTINKSNGVRNFLKDEGGDGRVVIEVWVAMEAQLASHFSNSTVFSLSGKAGSALEITGKLTASSTGSGAQTITISKGTTFAYLLEKVKDWNKDKTQVLDMEDDQQSVN